MQIRISRIFSAAVLFSFLLFDAISGAEAPFPIRTPKPGPAPRINGPLVYGCRPGMPFIYRIPATGMRPMQFSASGLPNSLKVDPATGIITGTVPRERGEYRMRLGARNGAGNAEREFRIVAGEELALTPPMGYNHWYTHYDRVTDKTMRDAADILLSSGMADAGYQYVNIDDCWMVKVGSTDPEIGGATRDEKGVMRTNRRFPDMKALTAYIHARGLKAGIYTSPGPRTCAGFEGAWKHEELDARTFADWGFDFLKYDWCSYREVAGGKSVEHLKHPYIVMGDILKKQNREIVLNLCQYGMGDVWKWGAEVGGHSWRTTGDLGLEKDTRLPGFYSIGFKNAAAWEYARPGAWNDPDYILIGWVGNAHDIKQPPARAKLTAGEQYSYVAMWALMAAPLFYSGEMSRLDEFTLNVLCNPEVIDVDQDPLGRQARPLRRDENEFVLAKSLADGSFAVGLFNLSEKEQEIRLNLAEVGLRGRARVRDIWRQRDLETVSGSYGATVGGHDVMMVRLVPAE